MCILNMSNRFTKMIKINFKADYRNVTLFHLPLLKYNISDNADNKYDINIRSIIYLKKAKL